MDGTWSELEMSRKLNLGEKKTTGLFSVPWKTPTPAADIRVAVLVELDGAVSVLAVHLG